MEHPGLAVAGCIGLVVVGFGLGQCSAPDPVEVPPEVIVKTITKTETVTKEVPGSLPSECVEAIAMMHDLGNQIGIIDASAGTLEQQAFDMNKYSVMRDLNAMVAVIEAQAVTVSEMGTAVTETDTLIYRIDEALEACESSMP